MMIRLSEADADVAPQCHGVRLSTETLDELDANHAVVSIRHQDIVRVTLKRGVASERTALIIVVALLLIGFALLLMVRLVQWYLYGGVAYDVHFALLFLGPVGVWLLAFAFRKRFYLLVEAGDDVRKISFARDATRDAVEAFVDQMRQSVGYPVRIALDD